MHRALPAPQTPAWQLGFSAGFNPEPDVSPHSSPGRKTLGAALLSSALGVQLQHPHPSTPRCSWAAPAAFCAWEKQQSLPQAALSEKLWGSAESEKLNLEFKFEIEFPCSSWGSGWTCEFWKELQLWMCQPSAAPKIPTQGSLKAPQDWGRRGKR